MPYDVKDSDLLFHFLNVGFGDNIIVEFPAKAGLRSYGLVDCYKHDKTRLYLDQLRNLRPGHNNLEFICATHPHFDHICGIKKFIENPNYRPKQFWDSGFRHKSDTYLKILEAINDYDVDMVRVSSGMEWVYDHVQVTALAPSIRLRNNYATYGVDMNNASIVLRFENHKDDYVLLQSQEYKGRSSELADRTAGQSVVILTGDAEFDSWSYIVDEFPRREKQSEHNPLVKKILNQLSCSVLKVAHHGSMHSAPLDVYEKMKPEHAIISTKQEFSETAARGIPLKRNLFPHPTSELSLEEVGASILTTDGCYESSDDVEGNMRNPLCSHPGSIVVAVPRGGTPVVKKYADGYDDDPVPTNVL